jgi:hypothetical protein
MVSFPIKVTMKWKVFISIPAMWKPVEGYVYASMHSGVYGCRTHPDVPHSMCMCVAEASMHNHRVCLMHVCIRMYI